MKKKIFAVLTVCLLFTGLLTACGSNDPITAEKAQEIALKEAGLKADQVSDIHTHIVEEKGIPCFQIHFTSNGKDMTVLINAATGEVISNG